jgi:hypothetical protein
LEEGVRIWNDPSREPEWLGRPEHEHEFLAGTQLIKNSILRFSETETTIRCAPIYQSHIMVGTGYGLEQDWKHGMYQGELVVQSVNLDTTADKDRMWGLVEATAHYKFERSGQSVQGYGMMEYMFLGPFEKYGFQ